MDLGIRGKTALITGASRGLGASIAEHLAAEGARIVVADVDTAAAESRAEAIRGLGGEAIAQHTDVTMAADVERMFEAAKSAFGSIDILVNNAGFTRDMRITNMSEADWDMVVDVILKGAFLCTKAAVPHMIEAGGGRIINMSSRAHLGNKGQANYSAGKAGLIGFTRAMSLELGRWGITVNAVAPGIIGTAAVRDLPHFDKIMEAAEKTTPIPRIGEPEDVAALVTFLASARASYITGDVVHVTGGRY